MNHEDNTVAQLEGAVLLPYLDAAREFARLGGEVSLRYFGRDIAVDLKADESPVTVADRETEIAIRGAIERRFPDHAVVGEEYGGTPGQHEWEWIVDPIDGTKSFIRGVPLYTTLVALVHWGQPVVGVIFAPATGQIAAAALGLGAWNEQGDRLSVSTCVELSTAWYVTTDPREMAKRHPGEADRLLKSCGASRTWADAYGYMLLARGSIDLMIDPIMSPWDIAPLSVVVREAGGIFTNLGGMRDDLGSSAIAAASPALHQEVLEIFA